MWASTIYNSQTKNEGSKSTLLVAFVFTTHLFQKITAKIKSLVKLQLSFEADNDKSCSRDFRYQAL